MDLILVWAIPFFVVLLVLEVAVLRRGEAAEAALAGDATVAGDLPRRMGYSRRDTRTSLVMGTGSLVIGGAWKLVELALLGWVATLTPLDLGTGWQAWLVALVGVDLMYYAYHRSGHEIRLLWASHVVHHSSNRYNLSTALRQPWLTQHTVLFFVPVALVGVPAELVLASYALNLVYQFWIHTEAIDRMWAPVEAVFNTPSHHRVHHGSQSQYLDRNYGGVLIVWDRLFGTFEPEGERVRYGLTTPLEDYRAHVVVSHELVAIWRDLRGAGSWRDRAGYVLRGPGWAPAQTLSG